MNKREYLLVLPFLLFSLLLSAQASLEKEQWFVKARPCWVSNAQVEQNITVSLHAVVDLTQFSTARFRIAAVSSYKLYLNGEFLGYGPSIAAHGFFRVDEYNVKTKLKKGRNILAIDVAGYNVDNYYDTGALDYIKQLDNDTAIGWIQFLDNFVAKRSNTNAAKINNYETICYRDYIKELDRGHLAREDFESVLANRHKFIINTYTDDNSYLSKDPVYKPIEEETGESLFEFV